MRRHGADAVFEILLRAGGIGLHLLHAVAEHFHLPRQPAHAVFQIADPLAQIADGGILRILALLGGLLGGNLVIRLAEQASDTLMSGLGIVVAQRAAEAAGFIGHFTVAVIGPELGILPACGGLRRVRGGARRPGGGKSGRNEKTRRQQRNAQHAQREDSGAQRKNPGRQRRGGHLGHVTVLASWG